MQSVCRRSAHALKQSRLTAIQKGFRAFVEFLKQHNFCIEHVVTFRHEFRITG